MCRFQRLHPSPPPSLPLSTPASSAQPTKPPQPRSIAAVFSRPPASSSTATVAAPRTATLTDDQKSALSHSSPRPLATSHIFSAAPRAGQTSTTSTFSFENSSRGGSLASEGRTQTTRSSFHMPGELPRIYMSASQPHAVDGLHTVGKKRGTGEEEFSPPVSMSMKMPRLEFAANQPPPRHNDTSHSLAQVPAQTHGVTGNLQHERTLTSSVAPTSEVVSVSSGTSTAPVTSGITSLPSRDPGTRNHGPSFLPGEEVSGDSLLIATDSSVVRPTPSVFQSLQQHQAVVPTPISLPSSSDAMTHPLKLVASFGPSFLGDLSLDTPPPISTALSKQGKTTQDTALYNVHVNAQNTLLSTEKGSVKVKAMQDTLIQKPMVGLDMEVLSLGPLQNTSITSLKDSTLKDTTMVKGSPKMNQHKIGALSEGKGVLSLIKITQGPPRSNISPEQASSKSLSLATSYSDDERGPSPATDYSSAENPVELAPSVPNYTVNDRVSPLVTSNVNSYTPSPENGCSDTSESDPESLTTTNTGPLVEYTGTYEPSSTMSTIDQLSSEELQSYPTEVPAFDAYHESSALTATNGMEGSQPSMPTQDWSGSQQSRLHKDLHQKMSELTLGRDPFSSSGTGTASERKPHQRSSGGKSKAQTGSVKQHSTAHRSEGKGSLASVLSVQGQGQGQSGRRQNKTHTAQYRSGSPGQAQSKVKPSGATSSRLPKTPQKAEKVSKTHGARNKQDIGSTHTPVAKPRGGTSTGPHSGWAKGPGPAGKPTHNHSSSPRPANPGPGSQQPPHSGTAHSNPKGGGPHRQNLSGTHSPVGKPTPKPRSQASLDNGRQGKANAAQKHGKK